MKKIFSLLICFIMVFSVISYADASKTVVINDLGDYKIIGDTYVVTPPHGESFYLYKNYGVTDKDGNIIIHQKYRKILPHTDKRAMFEDNDGNIGFFDENWNIVIDAKYFSNGPAISFSEGYAAIGKRHDTEFIKWGYIDRDGNEITEFIYDHAEAFENGEAWVGIDEEVFGGFNTKLKWGKIDTKGNLIKPFKFAYALERDYEYLWQDPIDILLSENLVEINGSLYKNSDLEYPFINYLGYSYLPLTYHGARSLGINCDWTSDTGVVLSTGGTASKDITGYNGMTEGVYDKASFYRGKLTINGKVYEYGDTAYPLIHYKNVVYVPVLWTSGMDEMGIEYTYVGPEKLENSDRGILVFNLK